MLVASLAIARSGPRGRRGSRRGSRGTRSSRTTTRTRRARGPATASSAGTPRRTEVPHRGRPRTRGSRGRRPARAAAALLLRKRVAGRVLEVGDDVGELRAHAPCRSEQPLERVHVDAVGLQLDGVDAGPPFAQRQQRAVVGGALDDHLVARSGPGARTGTRRPASTRSSPAPARVPRRGARRSSCAGAGSRSRCRRRSSPPGRSRRRAPPRRAGRRRRRCPATGRRGRRRWSRWGRSA